MKFYCTTFNANHRDYINDGWSYHNLIEYGGLKHFAERVNTLAAADFVVYVRFTENDYEFDGELANQLIQSNKPIIVFDYSEIGAAGVQTDYYLSEYDILGYELGINFFNVYKNEQFLKLYKFFNILGEKGLIKCYFKRELSRCLDLSKIPFSVYPCDFMNHEYTAYPCGSRKEFDSKNIDIFYSWGLSSIDRPELHGKILQNIDKFGNIAMSRAHLERAMSDDIKNLIFLYRAEWYDRIDYKQYIPKSRTMIDLYGAGMKCFRNLESALDSVSFKQNPSKLIHAYEWVDGKNCIYLPNKEKNKLDIDVACDIIYDYTRRNQGKLYDIYIESKKTAECYLNKHYSIDYIYPKIKNAL